MGTVKYWNGTQTNQLKKKITKSSLHLNYIHRWKQLKTIENAQFNGTAFF